MEQNETTEETSLTEKQLAALPYLLAAPSLSEGARLADVGRTTLYRWMNDDRFRSELESLRAEAARLAHSELRGLMLKGTLILAESMEDEGAFYRALLELNATDVVHGAYGLENGELIISDTLELETLDFHELRASTESIELAATSHMTRIRALAGVADDGEADDTGTEEVEG